jgi:hypothetical protein
VSYELYGSASIPGSTKFVSSPWCPYRFWGPTSLQSNGYLGPLSLICLHGVVLIQLDTGTNFGFYSVYVSKRAFLELCPYGFYNPVRTSKRTEHLHLYLKWHVYIYIHNCNRFDQIFARQRLGEQIFSYRTVLCNAVTSSTLRTVFSVESVQSAYKRTEFRSKLVQGSCESVFSRRYPRGVRSWRRIRSRPVKTKRVIRRLYMCYSAVIYGVW